MKSAFSKFRHKATVVGAELVADAYYTAFVLAREGAQHGDLSASRVLTERSGFDRGQNHLADRVNYTVARFFWVPRRFREAPQ
jgi:hypothetical protein